VHFVWIIENVYNLGLLVLGGWIKILVPAVMVMGNPRNFGGQEQWAYVYTAAIKRV
jgi:hypothetical protein